MDYLNSNAAPVREDRLKACNAFGGTCGSLVQGSKKGCLYGARRSFSQATGCQLNLSLAILQTIRDAVIIVHGPIGCGGATVASTGVIKNQRRQRDPGAGELIWLSTNLGEVDAIRGGEQKLKDTILYADREFRPSAIIVASSCLPALIGDDIDGLISGLQPQISATIVPVHCEGFKTRIMATAYDAVYHGILRNLVRPRSEEYDRIVPDELEDLREKYRTSRSVNLLNVSSMGRVDEVELARYLKALGLNTRVVPCFSQPDDFVEVTEAALNISICPTHDDYFVEHLKEKYGIPFSLRTIPIGIKNTGDWIREAAGFFGLEQEADSFIETETRELEKALAPYREVLKGKRALLAGGEIRVVATANLLQELGMEIIGLRAYHYDHFGDELFEALPGKENITVNVATGQPFEQANLLEKLKPDIYLGHVGGNGWAAKNGVPILPIFSPLYSYMGYAGVFETARRLVRLFKNPAFNRNLALNTRQPYFADWYKEDAYAYIGGNT